jgi:hypothetical protein
VIINAVEYGIDGHLESFFLLEGFNMSFGGFDFEVFYISDLICII